MLFVAVMLGWGVDHARTQRQVSVQLQQADDRHAKLLTEFFSFASWYGTKHSLSALPKHHYDAIHEIDRHHEIIVSPDRGFILKPLSYTHYPPSDVVERGFRVRGGCFRYEFICEDLTNETSVEHFRLLGPVETPTTNSVDGTFVHLKPRIFERVPGITIFNEPYTIGNGGLRPSDDDFVFTFAEACSSCNQTVPVTDVWPEWVFTSPAVELVEQSMFYSQTVPIPWGTPVVLFSDTYSTDDGKKARLRLIVTCTNKDNGLAPSPLSTE